MLRLNQDLEWTTQVEKILPAVGGGIELQLPGSNRTYDEEIRSLPLRPKERNPPRPSGFSNSTSYLAKQLSQSALVGRGQVA